MNGHASMNRIYRLVWSQVSGAWVPVAETTKGRGKSGRASSTAIGRRNALAVAISLALNPLAHAAAPDPACVAPSCGASLISAASHPRGAQVVSGSASITQSGMTTDIRQSSNEVSIDWLSFNVGSQATVDFVQPSASAVAVSRISSSNGSEILGHVDANGRVYLINPNGIVFGPGAEVNVGGLVASTLDATGSASSASQRFAGDGTGSIVNRGTITAANGGYVALIGNRISNQGVITAQLGTVAVGAGSAVTLDFSGNHLVHLQVDQSTLNNLAANSQLIKADGGLVVMTAGARNALLASVVNNTGVIEARTVATHNGTIELLGGMTAGAVNVGGTLDASAPDGGNGGFIETSAAHVAVANNAKVTTAAPQGLYGTWLIDPTDFTVAPSAGDITGAALSTDLNSTNFTVLSSTGTSAVAGGGSGGNINIDDTVSWTKSTTLTLTAANNVNVNSSITASGATAKLVINPNTTNGGETASGTGTLNLGAGAAITLSGATAGLSISTPSYTLGAGATINLPNVSPTATTALVIGGTPYTVINSLGAAGSTTGTDLQGINGNLSGHYALGSNVDATPTGAWNSGAGFTPIGTSTTPYTGIFDGLGHSISNLTIDLPFTNLVGLFGYTGTGSLVQNVGLLGGSVSGGSYVGGLVGTNNGTISNSNASDSVLGSNFLGGLVSFNSGTISNSYAAGDVSTVGDGFSAGGLVGQNDGLISTSHATGSVTGSTQVGGLVGLNYNHGAGTISNSYATGSVSGTGYFVGGLVGVNYGAGTISTSYATGRVTGADFVGGLVGLNNTAAGTISNSYAMGSVGGTENSVGGLVGQNYGTVSSSYATGRVTGSSGVGGLVGDNEGTVGNSYATGSVRGTGSVIGGLVGRNSGPVSNSYAAGSVTGSGYAGGLVGASYGTISNSYAVGSVTGSGDAGGLVGFNGGPVSNSYAAGRVSTTGNFVGGLVALENQAGAVKNSFWDVTTSGQSFSVGGGIGMTTANMQSQANFTSATAANGNVNPGWDFTNTWVMYNGFTYPLLRSFMTPLTVTANNASTTYNGAQYSGGNGVTYSVAPNANLLGTVSYSGSSQGAVNAGSYVITPGGLYSDQQGYILSYGSGSLTINQLASVAWVGGAIGNWSTPSNWAGGAIPDLSNVAAVTIPNNTTVTYDAGVPGTTILTTLTDAGKLIMAAGNLTTTGNLRTAGYTQTGGVLDVGGVLMIASTAGAVTIGNINAGSLSISSTKGAITQLAGSTLDVTGAASLTAGNGSTAYGITLAQAGDSFGGEVSSSGLNISLLDTSANGLTLGNTTATGALSDTSRAGAITQAASTAVDVAGTSSLAAYNGLTGASAVRYGITLANAGDSFGGTVTSNGSNISLLDTSTHGLTFGNTTAAGTFSAASVAGAITQAASTTLSITGTSSLTAGSSATAYGITLANATNNFVGAVSSKGLNVDLEDKSGGIVLGNTTATGTLSVTSLGGAITQVAATALGVTGTSSLAAQNGTGGTKYNITLAQTGDSFGGTVTAEGAAITLRDKTALTANLDASGASALTAAGALNISGTVGTTLKTTTTGTNHATTFGATTVGTSLTVTSTGAVTETSPNTLIVAGLDTTTAPNPDVTVNGVNDVEIPAP